MTNKQLFEDSFKSLIEIYNHFLAIQKIVGSGDDYDNPAMHSVDQLSYNLVALYVEDIYDVSEDFLKTYYEGFFDTIMEYIDDAVTCKIVFSIENFDKFILKTLSDYDVEYYKGK